MKIRQKMIVGFGIIIILSLIASIISITQMNNMNAEVDNMITIANHSALAEEMVFDVDYMVHMMHHALEEKDSDEIATSKVKYLDKQTEFESELALLRSTYHQFSGYWEDITENYGEIDEHINDDSTGIFAIKEDVLAISEGIHDDYPSKIAEIDSIIANESIAYLTDAISVKYHFERFIHLMHHYLEGTGTGVGGTTRTALTKEIGEYSASMNFLLVNSDLSSEYTVFNNYVNGSFVQSLTGSAGIFNLMDIVNSNSDHVHEDFPLLIDDLQAVAAELLALAESDASSAVSFATTLLIIIGIITVVLGLGISVYLTNSIANPLASVSKSMETGSTGDLTMSEKEENELIDISSSEDEIGILGTSYSTFLGTLRSLIGSTASNVSILATSSEEIVSGTEEINASAEEVASTSQAMSNGATTQTELINEVSEEIKQTTKLVDEIISSIRNNTNQVSQIALQTNILALNAGIEASRAGDYGRGFAVVAENIRKLSDQSKTASENISEVADEIAVRLEEAFNKISSTMLNVVSVSEETVASAEEVAAAAEEMTATIEELASAAQELSTQAESSQEMMSQFTIDEKYLK